MSDFNADNAKIDAALAAVAEAAERGPAREEVISTVTLTGSTTSWSISTADIDWSRYQYVRVDLQLVGIDADISLRPNGNSSGCSYRAMASNNTVAALGKAASNEPCVMLLLCYHDPERRLLAATLALNGGVGTSNSMTFQQLTSLVLTPGNTSSPIQSGSVIQITGIL